MNRLSLFVILCVGVLGLAVGARPVAAQDNNLLQNPGFEGQYSTYYPRTAQEHADCPAGVCHTVQIPAGWFPWWAKEWSTDANPEYKPATPPFRHRIHSGDRAGQYFSFHRTHKAGFYQQVTVPTNASLLFTIWGQAWVSNDDGTSSDRGAPINMRIGIDPTGGTNPYSGNVVWSGLMQPHDAYQQFSVQAQAQGNQVTVFTYSAPSYPVKHNDVYWDDAVLIVAGPAAAPPSPPPATGSNGTAPAPAAGTHVVQSGEFLSAIAARYGVSLAALIAANNIADPNIIHTGQVLTIPGGTAPAPAPAPAAAGIQATTQANLRLRAGPDTAYAILEVAPYGTTLPVLGRNAAGNWIQVTYNGRTGWMAARYTHISGGTLAAVPVTG